MRVGDGGEVYTSVAKNGKEGLATASLSAGEVYKFPGLLRIEEQIGVAYHLPVSPSKNQLNGFHSEAITFEGNVAHAIAQFMLRSANFLRSLTSSDIIFPFHYFW